MAGTNGKMRHLTFFETLASENEGSDQWRAASAGLVVLRLFDSWSGRRAFRLPRQTWEFSAVRETIAQIDQRNSMRALLTSVIDAMELAPAVGVSTVAPRLLAYGRALQYEAKWSLAADVYRTVIESMNPEVEPELVVTANLQLGTCLRMLAEWSGATAAHSAAGEIAAMRGDIANVLRARLSEAKVAVERGNLPRADDILSEAAERACREGLAEIKAIAMLDRANIAHRRKEYEAAIRLGYQVLPSLPEGSLRDRALIDLAGSFLELGIRSAARDAYLIIAATAQEQYLRWVATINLMEVAAIDMNEPSFEQYRRELCRVVLPVQLAAFYWLYVGRAYRLFGKPELACTALRRAVQLGEKHELFEVLFKAEESLAEIEDGGVIIIAAPAELANGLSEVASALRHMRVLVAAGG